MNKAIRLTPILLLAATAIAQNDPRKPPQQPPVLKKAVAERVAALETELADLLQRRNVSPPAQQGAYDFRIDLRILGRWLTQQVLLYEPGGADQAAVWLRAQDLDALIATADAQAAKPDAAVGSPAISEAQLAVRKLTFGLAPTKELARIDAMLGQLRQPLLTLFAPPGAKTTNMRPATPKAAAGNNEPAAAPTLDTLSARVTRLNLSPAMRQQMLVAIAAAKSGDEKDASELLPILTEAIDAATLASANVGTDSADRQQLESQIGQAIALAGDSRLRDAAKSQIKSLAQYRRFAGQVAKWQLSPNAARALQPALTAARQDPKAGGAMMKAIEKFVAFDQALDTRPAPGTDVIARQINAQIKRYEADRVALLAASERLGGGGMFGGSAEDLVPQINALAESAATLDRLRRLPQSQTTINELRPRPVGAIEKRVTQALVKLADADAEQRAAAAKTIEHVDVLAQAWLATKNSLASPPPEAALQKYANVSAGELEPKLRTLAVDAASGLASGSVDEAKISALDRAAALLDRVRDLGQRDASLATPALQNWADVRMSVEAIDGLTDDYRQALITYATATFNGNAATEPPAPGRLAAVLDRIAAQASACAALPDGPAALVGRFTTSSHNAPFAGVRALSLATYLILSDDTNDAKLKKRLLDGLPAENE